MVLLVEEKKEKKEGEEAIPDPLPLEHMDDGIRRMIKKAGMTEPLFNKYHTINQYGSFEIRQNLADLEDSRNKWGIGDWNDEEEELEDYEKRVWEARTERINELYKEVITQFKQEHGGRLPWEEGEGETGQQDDTE